MRQVMPNVERVIQQHYGERNLQPPRQSQLSCARVVITQGPQGPVMFSRTAIPMARVWPTQSFSAKPFSPEGSWTHDVRMKPPDLEAALRIVLPQSIERGRGQ